MKFVCDSCNARYRIDDARVEGKALKIRCKRCGHLIDVRAPRAPREPSAAPPSVVEWHIAVNGATEGPFDEATVVQKFASGAVGDEAYVWNETFSDWKPALDVPVFAAGLHAAKAAGHRAEHPATERIDASEVLASDAGAAGPGAAGMSAEVSAKLQALRQEFDAAAAAIETQPEPAPEPELALEPEPETADEAKAAPALEPEPAPEPAAARAPEPAPALEPEPAPDPAAARAPKPAPAPEPEPETAAKAEAAPALEPKPEAAENDAPEAVAAGAAAPEPEPAPPSLRQPSASAAAVAAASVPPPGATPTGGDASASVLGASPSASLVFQIQQAKKQRNRAIAAVFVVLLLLIGLLLTRDDGADAVATAPDPAMPTTPAAAPAEPAVVAPIELTAAQRAALAQNEQVAILRAHRTVAQAFERAIASTPSAAAAAAAGAERAAAAPTAGSDGPSLPAMPSVVAPRERSSSRREAREPRGSEARSGTARRSLGSAAEPSAERVGVPTTIAGSEGFYGRVGGGGAQALPNLAAPELEDRVGSGPSAEHFRAGLSSFISDSVNRCTQRHIMAAGPMPQARISLTMTVQPSGNVSRVQVDRAMRGTAFDLCLQSQRERWSFPRFRGEATQLERTYIVQ